MAAPHRDAFEPATTAPYGPVAYQGGAVVLNALRSEIGPTAFERVEKTFLARHRHGIAGTEDYLDVVGEVAGAEPA